MILPLVLMVPLGSVGVCAMAAEKTALVTGSTDGIGLVTAKNLAAKGYNVLIHGRNKDRIRSAVNKVSSFSKERSTSTSCAVPLPARDLSTVAGTEQLAVDVLAACQEQNLSLDVLMNNAGVYSEDFVLTNDGLEQTFAVNVVAPFVLTSVLLDKLLESEKGRIVIASSLSQCGRIRDWDDLSYGKRSYSAHGAYSESKLLDAMLTVEFAERLKAAGLSPEKITCNCLDPGTVNTKMLLAGWGSIGIDVEDAMDETWLCSSKEVEGSTGQYFTYRSARRASGSAYDETERNKLWTILASLSPNAAQRWEYL